MSIAGVYSNRGDRYQTLIAFDWALSVLEDPEQYHWIDIDSVEYPVDDVVIGKSDGTLICCQCKKNQKDHRAWSFEDLKEELEKAVRLIAGNEKANVKFYSRSPFGNLSKLREYCEIQPNAQIFNENLPKKLLPTYEKLQSLTSSIDNKITTYDVIKRISYTTTDDVNRLKDLLRGRLHRMASNSDDAFKAIWTLLNMHGARIPEGAPGSKPDSSFPDRITRDVLKRSVEETGAVLVPIQDIEKIQSIYHQASSIGREWKRDINKLVLETPLVKEIMSAIHEKTRSILITGGPGSGKTCLLLNLQEELEELSESNSLIVPLFIQAREFADCKSPQDLESLGYPQELIQSAARLAEEKNVVAVIDSLDVLSISGNHWILKFFLTQIDQLLSIPDITIVVACRGFDRQYDYRIAVRTWEKEFECPPLSWEDQILPLLKKNNISVQDIEEDTRELIKNPRELDLFVELSLKEENVNHVTSQELAERYIDVLIVKDSTLGDAALEAIEDIATQMLKDRSLIIPRSRFSRPDLIPKLLSLNILQASQNDMITLGHQTLLDILVVRKMYRKNITLHKFISELKPVPFIRPSIRSFINHLSVGNKKTFKKQMRAVLTGKLPFHIRRLAAEKISTFIPSNEDWPLLSDLRENHKEVFQVIYHNANGLQWFDFWNNNLVPLLRAENDTEGLIAHVRRISQWKNDKPEEVIAFWKEILERLEMNIKPDHQFIFLLGSYLSKIDIKHAKYIVPILDILLKLPNLGPGYLGHVLVKCLNAKVIDDKRIWDYIVSDLTDEDVKTYDFGNQLHYEPQEFGKGKEFLLHLMNDSKTLLNIAITDIERWSKIKWGNLNDGRISYWKSFLSVTSYEKSRNHGMDYGDDKNELFDTIESSIANHAKNNSDWWIGNKDRLIDSPELSFRYFVILACTSNPETNLEIIQRILTNKEMLESGLSYEIGLLIQQSFIHLKPAYQNKVTECILNLYKMDQPDSDLDNRKIIQTAKYIKYIPAFKRSAKAQNLIDSIEKNNQPLELQSDIHSQEGFVKAPFSYKVFLNNLNDDHIIDLLKYYNDFKYSLIKHFAKGKEAVGRELREASSRNPQRFLELTKERRSEISDYFVDQIVSGITWFIEYKYGNYPAPNNWELVDRPDISYIQKHLLNILDKISKPSNDSHSQSQAIKACAHIIDSSENAFRAISLVLGYRYVHIDEDQARMDIINGAEALIILANRLIEKEITFPDTLVPTLSEFIQDKHPPVRAAILRRLPYFLYHRPDDGWNLLKLALDDSALDDSEGLWSAAERCLYQMYYNHYDKVSVLLERLYNIGTENDYDTWGRISALSVLAGHINIEDFIKSLSLLKSEKAWKGALTVWTNSRNIKAKKEICLRGIRSGFESNIANTVAIEEMADLLRNNNFTPLPMEIITLYLSSIAKSEKKHLNIYGLEKWLNKLAQTDPESALYGIEADIEYTPQKSPNLHDSRDNLTQLMTRLFAEAEEREESDNGNMLQRVVSIQDKLLMLGVRGIDEWLKAAERP